MLLLLYDQNRVQFFQLADIFLASGMVPAYTAAAFAKKMARLALKAPPAGAMIAIGFIHNVIRRYGGVQTTAVELSCCFA